MAVGFVALLSVVVLRPAEDSFPTLRNLPASDFTLQLYSGGRLHLAGLHGKTVVVNFWWSGCPPCIQEAPILERQWRAWRHKDVVFVGVDELDDPASTAPLDFLKAYDITYPNGPDPNYVNIEYGTTGQPETVFITPQGRISNKYPRPFSDDQTLGRLIQEARTSVVQPQGTVVGR